MQPVLTITDPDSNYLEGEVNDRAWFKSPVGKGGEPPLMNVCVTINTLVQLLMQYFIVFVKRPIICFVLMSCDNYHPIILIIVTIIILNKCSIHFQTTIKLLTFSNSIKAYCSEFPVFWSLITSHLF